MLKKDRYMKAVIIGIIDATLVLIQKKDGSKEICPTSRLYLEEESFDIGNLTNEEISKLIPEHEHTENISNDFSRFKDGLIKRVEDAILKEKMSKN